MILSWVKLGPNPKIGVLIRDTESIISSRSCHTEAQSRQPCGRWQSLEWCSRSLGTPGPREATRAGRGPGRGRSLPSSLQTPWFQTPGLQTVQEQISVVLSHPVCGNLVWQVQGKNTEASGLTEGPGSPFSSSVVPLPSPMALPEDPMSK